MADDRAARWEQLDYAQRSALLAAFVAPRPLAWITSRSSSNVTNIAPFNSFTSLANNPPLIGLSFSPRDGEPKDSLANIEATGEFVLNAVTRQLSEAMNESARECGRETDDIARLGLTTAPIENVQTPRIAESPAALACRVESIQPLPPSQCRFVVARVVGFHGAIDFDPIRADTLASIGALRYARLCDPFDLPKTWG